MPDQPTIEPADLVTLVLAGGSLAARRRLLDQHRNPHAALNAGRKAWTAAGLSEEQIQRLARPGPACRQTLDWLAQSPDHHLIGWCDPAYPPLLMATPNPPIALFLRGDPGLLWQPQIAIIGSRRASNGGNHHAGEIARDLSQLGLLVSSGLASGIDASAHRSALAAGFPSLAVVGTGPDISYPASHHALQEQLAQHGVIVSEFPPGTPPRAAHFPARNRILAGLSLAVVVVEAAERSGALLTARLAAEAGREVFAVPGSVRNPLSRGCHRLLRDGAGLLESAQDLLPALSPLLHWLTEKHTTIHSRMQHENHAASPQTGRLEGQALMVWEHLDDEPVELDELVKRSGLTVDALSSILLLLELDGWVIGQHGRYAKNPASPPPQRLTAQAEVNEREHSGCPALPV